MGVQKHFTEVQWHVVSVAETGIKTLLSTNCSHTIFIYALFWWKKWLTADAVKQKGENTKQWPKVTD